MAALADCAGATRAARLRVDPLRRGPPMGHRADHDDDDNDSHHMAAPGFPPQDSSGSSCEPSVYASSSTPPHSPPGTPAEAPAVPWWWCLGDAWYLSQLAAVYERELHINESKDRFFRGPFLYIACIERRPIVAVTGVVPKWAKPVLSDPQLDGVFKTIDTITLRSIVGDSMTRETRMVAWDADGLPLVMVHPKKQLKRKALRYASTLDPKTVRIHFPEKTFPQCRRVCRQDGTTAAHAHSETCGFRYSLDDDVESPPSGDDEIIRKLLCLSLRQQVQQQQFRGESSSRSPRTAAYASVVIAAAAVTAIGQRLVDAATEERRRHGIQGKQQITTGPDTQEEEEGGLFCGEVNSNRIGGGCAVADPSVHSPAGCSLRLSEIAVSDVDTMSSSSSSSSSTSSSSDSDSDASRISFEEVAELTGLWSDDSSSDSGCVVGMPAEGDDHLEAVQGGDETTASGPASCYVDMDYIKSIEDSDAPVSPMSCSDDNSVDGVRGIDEAQPSPPAQPALLDGDESDRVWGLFAMPAELCDEEAAAELLEDDGDGLGCGTGVPVEVAVGGDEWFISGSGLGVSGGKKKKKKKKKKGGAAQSGAGFSDADMQEYPELFANLG